MSSKVWMRSIVTASVGSLVIGCGAGAGPSVEGSAATESDGNAATAGAGDVERIGTAGQAVTASGMVFRDTDTMAGSTVDWDPNHGKATCAAGATISGLSAVPADHEGRDALCATAGTSTFSGNVTATLVLAGSDNRRAQRLGDWAPGYYKLECGAGEYASGVSEDASFMQGDNRFHAIQCSQGVSLSPSGACTARAFDTGDNRGTTSDGDWDVGAYKGECAPGEYVAGVSISTSTGGPHSILCCAAQPPCPAGQTLVTDTGACVTLTAWSNLTDLPAGSKIAIRLRVVMTDYSGHDVAWPNWVGVSTSDNQTLDAVDAALTSRDIFTATTFHPGGVPYYDLPWYNMLASNGMYVGGNNSQGTLVANQTLANAGVFARGSYSWDAPDFLLKPVLWSQAQSWYDQIHTQGGDYSMCQSPFTLGTPHITQWLNGGAPNYGCYASGAVDYFIVQ